MFSDTKPAPGVLGTIKIVEHPNAGRGLVVQKKCHSQPYAGLEPAALRLKV